MWCCTKLNITKYLLTQGLVSQKILDENELDNIPVRKLKALAVQTRIEAELICGRKQGI